MAATAITEDSVVDVVRQYIQELQKNGIAIEEVVLSGSYAKGKPKDGSDIDVAIVSPAFTGDRFEDRRKIVPLRREIDSRIEPIPFSPADFLRGGNFADEIKKTGIKIAL
jgi:predicted nucleotidyltransferase